jgi:hypothetical protein
MLHDETIKHIRGLTDEAHRKAVQWAICAAIGAGTMVIFAVAAVLFQICCSGRVSDRERWCRRLGFGAVEARLTLWHPPGSGDHLHPR